MSRVTILTPIRDGSHHFGGYCDRLAKLDWPAADLRMVLVEDDHLDDTANLVRSWLRDEPRARSIYVPSYVPKFPSIVHAERFAILSRAFNAGIEAIDLAWSDYMLMLPVDIVYQPDLLHRLTAWNLPVIAPFVFQSGVFYDTWAFSMNNQSFGPFPVSTLLTYGYKPIEMTTIGGTMLVASDVLRRGVRYTEDEVDRGFSHAARSAGFRVYADPTTIVYHEAL